MKKFLRTSPKLDTALQVAGLLNGEHFILAEESDLASPTVYVKASGEFTNRGASVQNLETGEYKTIPFFTKVYLAFPIELDEDASTQIIPVKDNEND